MVQAWGWRGFLTRVLAVLGIALALGLGWKFRRGLWSLTKAGLRAGFVAIGRLVRGKRPPPEHPLAPRLRTLVPECTDPQGRTLIPLSRLAELLEYGLGSGSRRPRASGCARRSSRPATASSRTPA